MDVTLKYFAWVRERVGTAEERVTLPSAIGLRWSSQPDLTGESPMTTASRSLATAPCRARFASGLLPPSYTTTGDVTIRPVRRSFRMIWRYSCKLARLSRCTQSRLNKLLLKFNRFSSETRTSANIRQPSATSFKNRGLPLFHPSQHHTAQSSNQRISRLERG